MKLLKFIMFAVFATAIVDVIGVASQLNYFTHLSNVLPSEAADNIYEDDVGRIFMPVTNVSSVILMI